MMKKQYKKKVDHCYDVVGGRLRDIEYVIANVEAGQNSYIVLNEMIEKSKENIRRTGFGDNLLGVNPRVPWPKNLMWNVMCELKKRPTVPYDEMLLNIFLGNETYLRAMIQAKLLTVNINDEGQKEVMASSPLFRTAFNELIEKDELFSRSLQKQIKIEALELKSKEIKAVEDDLVKINLVTGGTIEERKRQIQKKN